MQSGSLYFDNSADLYCVSCMTSERCAYNSMASLANVPILSRDASGQRPNTPTAVLLHVKNNNQLMLVTRRKRFSLHLPPCLVSAKLVMDQRINRIEAGPGLPGRHRPRPRHAGCRIKKLCRDNGEPLSHTASIDYPIPTKEAVNALVTLFGLRVSMGGGDHLLSGGSQAR
ncbi:hypothetical protein EVAR_78579_1 [Eumeta japonica]|uniref:Uncharacterized protein n=1 Tax=Eumeta variegata TaxID=151549 RepID=A0A4C1W677_EUMVA|nr:hypothetical protein EVAR_78579_1 [Eumeta japonica]